MSPDSRLAGLHGEVVIRPTPAAVAEDVAAWIAALNRRAVGDHGSFSIALCGGSTPRLLYALLAGEAWRRRIDWTTWRVYFGDERACPPDDPRSNFGMAQRTLLGAAGVDPLNVHRMRAELGDVDAAAVQYSALMAEGLPPAASGAPRLDCILLGLGENGHTASLFPGTAALEVADRWATRGLADYEPRDRITLTFAAINAASSVAFLVTGASKQEPLLATARCETPASRVHPDGGTLVWFLDADAAGRELA